MSYDYDVLVVGGGPAGLAAALRVRWLKRHHCVPCSVLLCDPGGPGGLMRMGATFLTGPSWAKPPREMLAPFLRDLERFEIPVVQEEIVEIRRERSDLFTVRSQAGRQWTALAVILATGMRPLTNDPEYFTRGLEATCMSYEYVQTRLKQLFSNPKEFPLVFIGSGKLLHLMRLTESLRQKGQRVTYILQDPDPAQHDEARRLAPGDVIAGRLEGFQGKDWLSAARVNGREVPCRTAVVDFNSFELQPVHALKLSPELERRPGRFLAVDRAMATSCPGIFAAGDITGTPAAVTKSLGEGVVAGFSAYTYVYRRKFNAEPALFAYVPLDRPLDEPIAEIPEAIRDMPPVPLVGDATLRDALEPLCPGRREPLLEALHSRRPRALQHALDDAEAGATILRQLVRDKLVTVHWQDA